MKMIRILFFLLIGVTMQSNAQTKLNMGIGYFGETVTYPGVIGEIEYENFHTDKFSTPLRVNIGFYNHPRSHNAIFLDFHQGFRRYFKNQNWFFEQNIGIGTMLSFYNENVWHVDDDGNSALVSNTGNWDFMPSVTLGFGKNITPKKETAIYVWLRPKIYWQYPFNNLANVHTALQIGFSYNLKTK